MRIIKHEDGEVTPICDIIPNNKHAPKRMNNMLNLDTMRVIKSDHVGEWGLPRSNKRVY